jgi:hypothetical protein
MAKQVKITIAQLDRIHNLQSWIYEIDALISKANDPKRGILSISCELDEVIHSVNKKLRKFEIKKLQEIRLPLQKELDTLLIRG